MCTRSQIPVKKFSLADAYDLYWEPYIKSKERNLALKDKHFEAVNKARACGSEKLGIAVFCCTGCGDTTYITRACKHRFCARCGNADTNQWAEQTLSRLLNIKHHHVIATLPKQLRIISLQNDNKLTNLLFQTIAEVIKSWFCTKHNILPGIVSVLHTAGSDLKYHPHIHMIVSGGGLDLKTNEFRKLESDFLCQQQFFGRQLKIKFLQALMKLHKKGIIKVPKRLQDPRSFKNYLFQIKQKHWIVSVQKPLEDVYQIVAYVGRYTKRACLSEYKIVSISPNIQFKFNDYKNSKRGHKPVEAIRTMKPFEFLDHLLEHVPDKRYRMVRYYGLYNSKYINQIPDKLKIEKKKVDQAIDKLQFELFEDYRKAFIKAGLDDPLFCKFCNQDKVLYGIRYKNSFHQIYVDDTS